MVTCAGERGNEVTKSGARRREEEERTQANHAIVARGRRRRSPGKVNDPIRSGIKRNFKEMEGRPGGGSVFRRHQRLTQPWEWRGKCCLGRIATMGKLLFA